MVKNESGQAITEYILLLFTVVFTFILISRAITTQGWAEKFTRGFRKEFASTYKYGHPRAKGYDEGTPEYHPRVPVGANNFRLFLFTGRK